MCLASIEHEVRECGEDLEEEQKEEGPGEKSEEEQEVEEETLEEDIEEEADDDLMPLLGTPQKSSGRGDAQAEMLQVGVGG